MLQNKWVFVLLFSFVVVRSETWKLMLPRLPLFFWDSVSEVSNWFCTSVTSTELYSFAQVPVNMTYFWSHSFYFLDILLFYQLQHCLLHICNSHAENGFYDTGEDLRESLTDAFLDTEITFTLTFSKKMCEWDPSSVAWRKIPFNLITP